MWLDVVVREGERGDHMERLEREYVFVPACWRPVDRRHCLPRGIMEGGHTWTHVTHTHITCQLPVASTVYWSAGLHVCMVYFKIKISCEFVSDSPVCDSRYWASKLQSASFAPQSLD